ncbi:DUF3237 family protein [Streptomonospora wellingtoniae]|uniref:UPF0311 protein RM446_01885 n=1 Tax=Streptomonospora wellingtoniae TaxID=3075544 RepID=A0ABU2KNN1_9ACTN|nr:DUF3237 family protein [Streptomonospora sp. DSM 45055]MDT0300858.1 DUF3237 family protein [Streptomonospora sp. DSM 45055]
MALALEHAFTVTVELGEVREVGLTPAGYRRVIPIVGGSVRGPALAGEVLPGGADWNLVRPDGGVHVWARYEIRTAEGAVISVVNEGLGNSGAGARSCATRPVFEAPEGGPVWLNTAFFVGELRLPTAPGGPVGVEVHRVLAG